MAGGWSVARTELALAGGPREDIIPGKARDGRGQDLISGIAAKGVSEKVIALYGSKCYVDSSNPLSDIINALVGKRGPGICRVKANNCVDMLADAQPREEMSGGRRVYWLTPGWIANWRYIFRDWDSGSVNETFPPNEKAILPDGIGFFEQYSQDEPDRLLAFSDWMRIPIEPYPVSLDRLRRLLSEQAESCR